MTIISTGTYLHLTQHIVTVVISIKLLIYIDHNASDDDGGAIHESGQFWTLANA